MAEINNKHEAFVNELLKLRCKSQTQAAINAGYSPKTAASQASQLLKKPKIVELLQEKRRQIESELRDEFLFDALEARTVMHEILTDPTAENKDRIVAARDFLDRAGFKPQDKLEHSGSVQTGNPELLEILEQLRGGVNESDPG